MNKCIFIGRFTKKPELLTTATIPVCKFSLAIQRDFKDANGERGVDFIDCVSFRNQAELIVEHCNKGDRFGVVGRYQKEPYDYNGETRYQHQFIVDGIEFLESKETSPYQVPKEEKKTSAADEDLPF